MHLTSPRPHDPEVLPARPRIRRRPFAPAAWLIAATIAAASAGAAVQAGGQDEAPGGVETVIALVKGGMSEALVIRTIRQEGRTYTLSTADLLALTSAGVSEAIIDAMTGPPAAVAAPAGGVTPFPPDLPDVGASTTKRRLAVRPFDYSTVTTWVNHWFGNDQNIGEGIRAMLTVRMAQSNTITLLERSNIDDVMREQDFAGSNRVRQGTGASIGQLSGADVMLYGDIVIFGRDDTTQRRGAAAIVRRFSPIGGAALEMNQEEKAVVGINLRLVDAETGEVIETAEARGESSRTSRDFGAVLGGPGAAAGARSTMTSSNFEQTIIGEATSNAVTKVVEFLESRVPQMPARPRAIEGRVAVAGAGTATLALGSQDGVLRGDRFEILQINGEILDPATREVIDVDAVKIGELVVDAVRDRTASGAYGGQPLSPDYLSLAGKGYAARLMR